MHYNILYLFFYVCLFIIKLSINKHYICRPIRCGHPPPSALFRLVEVPQQTVELMNVPGECGEVRPQARTQLQRRQVSECEALRATRQVKREWSWGSVSSGNAIDHQIYVPSCVALRLWRVHRKMSFLFHCWAT